MGSNVCGVPQVLTCILRVQQDSETPNLCRLELCKPIDLLHATFDTAVSPQRFSQTWGAPACDYAEEALHCLAIESCGLRFGSAKHVERYAPLSGRKNRCQQCRVLVENFAQAEIKSSDAG
jgi:hypothetical protein